MAMDIYYVYDDNFTQNSIRFDERKKNWVRNTKCKNTIIETTVSSEENSLFIRMQKFFGCLFLFIERKKNYCNMQYTQSHDNTETATTVAWYWPLREWQLNQLSTYKLRRNTFRMRFFVCILVLYLEVLWKYLKCFQFNIYTDGLMFSWGICFYYINLFENYAWRISLVNLSAYFTAF